MSATTSSMKKSRKIIFRDFLSAAELADLVLNEPTRCSGELVNAANARKVAAIDGVRRRNAGVLAHEHRGDAHALGAQGADLGGGVVLSLIHI